MSWKNLLRVILLALLPVVYGLIKSLYADFPLNQQQFVDLVLWVVGQLIGGWLIGRLMLHYEKYGSLR